MNRAFRIGILGGMGPEAGVLLQSLIIQQTPAERDQDHLAVIAYTNPHVPDRTRSLATDGGESYLEAVRDSLQLLDKVGVDILAIACNTAHARFEEIQNSVKTPLLHLVNLAKDEIRAVVGRVGILATNGTLQSGLFGIPGHPEKAVAPGADLQRNVMAVIEDIKSGVKSDAVLDRLSRVAETMQKDGCVKLVLGCTELSIVYEELCTRQGPVFIDPLRLAARRLVEMAGAR